MSGMGRREFITLVGGAAVAWPLAARAQQPEGVRRIGVLMNLPRTIAESQTRIAALLQGLQQLGWTDGRNCGSISLGRRRCDAIRSSCGGIGRAGARTSSWPWAAPPVAAVAAGDPHGTDRVRAGH